MLTRAGLVLSARRVFVVEVLQDLLSKIELVLFEFEELLRIGVRAGQDLEVRRAGDLDSDADVVPGGLRRRGGLGLAAGNRLGCLSAGVVGVGHLVFVGPLSTNAARFGEPVRCAVVLAGVELHPRDHQGQVRRGLRGGCAILGARG